MRHRILLIAGLLLGFALRLYQLGADSLWYDETVSAYLASLSLTEMIAHTAGDIHPPGYYFLLHLWHIATQPTIAHGLEFLLAWPSQWCGLLILPLLYTIGRQQFNPNIALLAVWLAAINPFHIWYSQEVRMYTLGAMLGLVCWWTLLKITQSQPSNNLKNQLPYYLAYILCTVLGLYTLYYFIFLWITLNVMVIFQIKCKALQKVPCTDAFDALVSSLVWLRHWVVAQCAILILWLPWLPTFWQQATNPPVPPWRDPWQTFPQFLTSLSESATALLIGQTNFIDQTWPWTLITILIIALTIHSSLFTLHSSLSTIHYSLFPITLIYLITWLITPLYHVRYLFIYAPPFMFLLSTVLIKLWNKHKLYGLAATLCITTITVLSLHTYWHAPAHTSDDHRTAVAELAAAWRPGDVILVNAGWVHTALQTYWPTELVGADGVLYPPLDKPQRLIDIEQIDDSLHQVPIVRTGSVDGAPSLGWGNPASDFFAISQRDTEQALSQIAKNYTRIWHYRLYDTVNDPGGAIRDWLMENTTYQYDITYPGRDFLRVQLYTINKILPLSSTKDEIAFDQTIYLQAHQAPSLHHAGEPLYVTLWLNSLHELITDLNMSLRLMDSKERLLVQSDQPPLVPTSQWLTDQQYVQHFALPVPAAAKPGSYSLELVIYGQHDGIPLPLPNHERAIHGQRWKLGTVQLEPPQVEPEINSVLAQFDYIDLVSAQVNPITREQLEANLVWRPDANAYRDTYNMVLALQDDTGKSIQSWSGLAGGSNYPSGQWVEGMPVRDRQLLTLDQPLSMGTYRLMLRLERASDGLAISARQSWWPIKREWIEVDSFEIEID